MAPDAGLVTDRRDGAGTGNATAVTGDGVAVHVRLDDGHIVAPTRLRSRRPVWGPYRAGGVGAAVTTQPAALVGTPAVVDTTGWLNFVDLT